MTRRKTQKFDSLTAPDLTATDTMVHYAVAPFDRAARDMDRKWGVGRLPELVTTASAQKFGSAMAKLDAAIASNDPTETGVRAAVCIRGLAALDAEAEAAGAPKASPDVWEIEIDGMKVGIHRDLPDWPAIQEARPDLTLFNLRQVATALKAYSLTADVLAATQDFFPDAKVVRIKPTKPPCDFAGGGDDFDF
ncbi:hypothetical protein AN189_17570 [Loktanella sp. 3ANDIMAR09]|nr:hypothetical protein AN189_17570 [Loktanella sp. 3ANDIMAR09]